MVAGLEKRRLDAFRAAGGNFIEACGLCSDDDFGPGSTGVSETYVGRWLQARKAEAMGVTDFTGFGDFEGSRADVLMLLIRPREEGTAAIVSLPRSCTPGFGHSSPLCWSNV